MSKAKFTFERISDLHNRHDGHEKEVQALMQSEDRFAFYVIVVCSCLIAGAVVTVVGTFF